MPYIKCSECGGLVSSKEKVCVLCGAPLKNHLNTVNIHVNSCARIFGGKAEALDESMRFTFWNEETGRVLAYAYPGQSVSLELASPTTVRCHISLGYCDDALLEYREGCTDEYTLGMIDTFFEGTKLVIKEKNMEKGSE